MILHAPLAQRAAVPWAAAAGITLGLAAIVAARWLATRLGLDALLVGAAFGVALVALWVAAGGTPRRLPGVRQARRMRLARPRLARMLRGVAAGLALGLALVVVAIAGSWLGGLATVPGSLRPAAPFATWAAVTLVVATAEEGILRGVLFEALRSAGGTAVALGVTTLVFALMHVPLYGWGVVPLDLAVGLALGGLRLWTAGVVAPAVAHVVADVATWWL